MTWRATQICLACHFGHACHRFATAEIGVTDLYHILFIALRNVYGLEIMYFLPLPTYK